MPNAEPGGVYSPGTGEQSHGPEEHIESHDIVAVEFYQDQKSVGCQCLQILGALTNKEEYLVYDLSCSSKCKPFAGLRLDCLLKLCFFDGDPSHGIVDLLNDRSKCAECREARKDGYIC